MKSQSLQKIGFLVSVLICLSLSIVLPILARDLIRDQIIIPLLYLYWLLNLIVRSIDQQVIWLLLSFQALISLFYTLLSSKTKVEVYSPDAKYAARGRVNHWFAYVRMVRLGYYSKEYFASEVKKLLVAVIALQHHLPNRQVEKQLESGDILIPDEIQSFFFHRSYPSRAPFVLQWFLQLISQFKPIQLLTKSSVEEEELERVIAYIEEKLEEK